MTYILHQPGVGWWVPLQGCTPLGLQHTDLCFDDHSPDPFHYQNAHPKDTLEIILKIFLQNGGDAKEVLREKNLNFSIVLQLK